MANGLSDGLSLTIMFRGFNNLFKLLKALSLKKFHKLHMPVSNLSECFDHVNTPGSQIFPALETTNLK